MAQKSNLKNIGKRQIIGVINEIITKVQAIEMTLNVLILQSDKFKDKDAPTFQEFLEEKMKEGANDTSTDEKADGDGDTTSDNED